MKIGISPRRQEPRQTKQAATAQRLSTPKAKEYFERRRTWTPVRATTTAVAKRDNHTGPHRQVDSVRRGLRRNSCHRSAPKPAPTRGLATTGAGRPTPHTLFIAGFVQSAPVEEFGPATRACQGGPCSHYDGDTNPRRLPPRRRSLARGPSCQLSSVAHGETDGAPTPGSCAAGPPSWPSRQDTPSPVLFRQVSTRVPPQPNRDTHGADDERVHKSSETRTIARAIPVCLVGKHMHSARRTPTVHPHIRRPCSSAATGGRRTEPADLSATPAAHTNTPHGRGRRALLLARARRHRHITVWTVNTRRRHVRNMFQLTHEFDRLTTWDSIGLQELMVEHDQEEDGVREVSPGGHLIATTKKTPDNLVVGILLYPRWRGMVRKWNLASHVATMTLTVRAGAHLGDATTIQHSTAHMPSTMNNDSEQIVALSSSCRQGSAGSAGYRCSA